MGLGCEGVKNAENREAYTQDMLSAGGSLRFSGLSTDTTMCTIINSGYNTRRDKRMRVVGLRFLLDGRWTGHQGFVSLICRGIFCRFTEERGSLSVHK